MGERDMDESCGRAWVVEDPARELIEALESRLAALGLAVVREVEAPEEGR